MPTINSIEASYRLYLSRFSKQSTRKDYTMRFNVFLTWCSMERIDGLEEVNFPQFLDYVFLDRGVSPRTHNNYRTWLRSFTSWMRRQHLLEGDPLDGVPPMREPGKIRQPLSTAMLRQIREHLAAHDRHFLLAVMMEYVDLGVSNSYVTNNGTDPMCTRVDDTTRMPASADVITFMGGTNDVRNPNTVPLGTMADRGTDTFYGALHTIMQKLYTKYIAGASVANGKKVKIVICTPVKLLDSSKSSQSNTIANNAGVLYDWRGFIDAIKEVAAFYSFPVCDLHNLSGINPHLDRTVHGTESGYTGYYNPYITDGTHPTQEGAAMMADVLVGFLKSLK